MGLLDTEYGTVNAKKPKNSDRIQQGVPMNYRGLLEAAQNIPVAGDALSGGMAMYDAAKGDYGSAALNALGVLPFVTAGTVKGVGKAADALAGSKLTKHEIAHETARKNAVEMLGLPENNTAMDRARAMGFDTPAYHGTSKEFDSFNMGGSGKTYGSGSFFTDNPDVASTYASRDSGSVLPVMLRTETPVNVATNGANWNWIGKGAKVDAPKITVADKEGDALMAELTGVSESIPIQRKAFKKTVKQLFPDDFKYDDHISTDDLARWGNSQGYDSMVFDSIKDRGPNGIFHTEQAALPSRNTAIFEPSNIRSRFAAFDPARRNEADLLGNATPEFLSVLAGGGLLGLGGYSLMGDK
jgi:hypothetical protein